VCALWWCAFFPPLFSFGPSGLGLGRPFPRGFFVAPPTFYLHKKTHQSIQCNTSVTTKSHYTVCCLLFSHRHSLGGGGQQLRSAVPNQIRWRVFLEYKTQSSGAGWTMVIEDTRIYIQTCFGSKYGSFSHSLTIKQARLQARYKREWWFERALVSKIFVILQR
jgi:hypothetical protein